MPTTYLKAPSNRRHLHARVTGALLHRIGLVVAIAVATMAVLAVPARADEGDDAPAGVTDRHIGAITEVVVLESKLVKKLDGAGTSCKKATKIVSGDNLKSLNRLLAIVGTLDMSDPEIKDWVRMRGQAISDGIRETDAFQTCQGNAAFLAAARKHPLIKFMVPVADAADDADDDEAEGDVDDVESLSQADIKRGAASINAYRTLKTQIASSKSCVGASRVIKRDITAKTRKFAATRNELLRDPDDYKTAVFGPVYAEVDFELERLVQVCKTNAPFMTAAHAHPFLKTAALTYDARASVRPRAVTKKLIAEVDGLRGKMRRQALLAGTDDECDAFERHLISYGRTRDKLQARIDGAKINAAAKRWLKAYTDDDFLTSAKALMPAHVCRQSDEDVAMD